MFSTAKILWIFLGTLDDKAFMSFILYRDYLYTYAYLLLFFLSFNIFIFSHNAILSN